MSNPNYAQASHDTLQDGSSTDSVESSECSSSQESLSSTVDDIRNLHLSSSKHQKDNTSPSRQRRRRDVSHVQSSSSQSSSRPRLKPSFKNKRRHHHSPSSPVDQERVYRGPTPMIHPNPREFARLKIALENILPVDTTECFKFHILLEHLKLEEAQVIAESYSNSRHPYTNTMDALNQQYGQPHQLVLHCIVELIKGLRINTRDIKTFQMYALRARSLVGMLRQLGKPGKVELKCGSHVSRLLSKLPHDLRSSFRRFHLSFRCKDS